MAMAFSKQSFLTNIPPTFTNSHNSKKLQPLQLLSCRSSLERRDEDPSSNSSNEMRLAKLAIVTFAAGVLTLGSVHDAVAAKSGGRVGGQAFRSSAPRQSAPRINNSRTNIFINPPVAPPLIGGYGYGVPYFGGWGWSPFTFFGPGPSVAVGIGGGFELIAAFLFFGVVSAVLRSFTSRREDEDEDEF